MARLKGTPSRPYKPNQRIPSVTLQGPKGLERLEAYRRLRGKVTDFRGFTYDPKTGKAVFT